MKWLILGLGLLVLLTLWSAATPVAEASPSSAPVPAAIGMGEGRTLALEPVQRPSPGLLGLGAVAWRQPGERPPRLEPPPWLPGWRRNSHKGSGVLRRRRHRSARHRGQKRQATWGVPGDPTAAKACNPQGLSSPATSLQSGDVGATPVADTCCGSSELPNGGGAMSALPQAPLSPRDVNPVPVGAAEVGAVVSAELGVLPPPDASPAPVAAPAIGAAVSTETNTLTATGQETAEALLSPAVWAQAQWGHVELGDGRRTRRAVEIGAAMATHPSQSLPKQLDDPAALKAAYGLLNHPGVTLEKLLATHWEQTRQTATQHSLVLLVQDTTELDFTHFPTMEGLGPIGNGKGRGLLVHPGLTTRAGSTLAIVPGAVPQILGLADLQTLVRPPLGTPRPKPGTSPEGRVWAQAAEAVGKPPAGVRWVHVGDRGSDDFRFMHEAHQQGKDFLIRVAHNRLLAWDEDTDITPEMRKLMDFARSLPVQHRYTLEVPAHHNQPARTAQMHLAWAPVLIPPSTQAPPELRDQPTIEAWVVRVWEVNAPLSVQEPIEWILVTSVPTLNLADALERVAWYTCRWLVEEYHQCLKTGCVIEKRHFDAREDILRLLGFCGPIAVRLLQLRYIARTQPDQPAETQVDPLMVQVLSARLRWRPTHPLTIGEFWRGVAQLGGHLGRRRDGPPGWKAIWHGWQYLSDLTAGAHLYANLGVT